MRVSFSIPTGGGGRLRWRWALQIYTPLVGVYVVEHGLNVIAVFEAAFFLAAGEAVAEIVAPATLGHVAVPDLDLLVGRLGSFLKTPLEHLVIGTALEHPVFQTRVIQTEKIHCALIEARAEILLKVGMQVTGCHEADFIQHAAEVEDSTDGVFGRAWVFHKSA